MNLQLLRMIYFKKSFRNKSISGLREMDHIQISKDTYRNIVRVASGYLRSKWTRAILLLILAIFTALIVASVVTTIIEPFPGFEEATVFWWSFILLAVSLGLSNIFFAIQTHDIIIDPRIDLRYHSRVCELCGLEESEMLLSLYRTGHPLELEYSFEQTTASIEFNIPLLLIFVPWGIAGLILTLIRMIDQFIFPFLWNLPPIGFPLNLIPLEITIIMYTIFSIGLIYFGTSTGIIFQWNLYRRWKLFWITYWEYILEMFEPTEYGTMVSTEKGSWFHLLEAKRWGEIEDLSSDDSLEKMRRILKKKIKKQNLSDNIPDDMPQQEIIEYGNKISSLIHIRQILKDYKSDFQKLVSNNITYKELKEQIESITTLSGNDMKLFLKTALDEVTLIPIKRISFTVLDEIENLSTITDSETKKNLIELAESRLDILWHLSNSPLPNTLKWMGFFYSTIFILQSLIKP